jgi:hypothetical protein
MGALTPVQADAGIIADCISRLLGLGDSRSLSPKIIVDPNYDKFKKELSENPNAIPPIRPYQESLISNWELLTDFRFWWVPGNIWYRLMEETPNYDQLGAERRNSLDTQGIKLPDPEVINPKGQWVDAATAEQAVALREFYRIGGFSSSAGMPDHSMHTDFDTGPEIDGTPASPDHGIYTQDDMGGPDSGGGFGND